MSNVTYSNPSRPATELAAALTDLALEVLGRAGVAGDSVEMELELWRALTAGLERESRWQHWLGRNGEVPPDSALAQVVHRAALDVATVFTPDRDAADVDLSLRPWVARLRTMAEQRRLWGQVSARRESRSPRPLGRSGIVRQLSVTALN
jgi:hypothetical protein